jgi:two-component system, NtrC family, response regulator AtoC
MLLRILLVLKSTALRKRIRGLLSDYDVFLTAAAPGESLWSRIAHDNCDLIVADRGLVPRPIASSIAQFRALPDRPEIVVLADGVDPQEQAELLAVGCTAVLSARLPNEVLGPALARIAQRRLEWQNRSVGGERAEQPVRLADFVAASPVMRAFVELARRMVGSDSSLLILGETGVGKERLARAIHNESPRAAGPFIPVNCAALPETLLESELFGHEEGAFTGATRPRRGYFELAHRGTIFLDEIGEMPSHLQVKLLRVLQEYEIQRVGSEKKVPVDVRVMAATNRDLEQDIEARRFRRDLFYRLAVVTLTVPPLRERQDDIPELVTGYIGTFNRRLGRDVDRISAEALQALVTYRWPGNVRELANVIERAVLLCAGREITAADLPHNITGAAVTGAAAASNGGVAGGVMLPPELFEKPWAAARQEALAAFERAYVARLLAANRGRIGDSAEQAGIEPRSLFEKMRRHGLRKEEFKRRRR